MAHGSEPSPSPAQTAPHTDFVLQKNIDLFRLRLRDEDDVNKRLQLWQLIREMEIAQQTLQSERLRTGGL